MGWQWIEGDTDIPVIVSGPAECVRWARTETDPLWVVQGNHDHALGHDADPRCSAAYRELAATMQRYTTAHLTPGARKHLAHLPQSLAPRIGGARLFLCHAAPTDPLYASA